MMQDLTLKPVDLEQLSKGPVRLLACIACVLVFLSNAHAQGSSAQRIKTDPDPCEPYLLSQAIRVGDLVFVSGQVGMDLKGALVGGSDFEAQGEQALKMLRLVLEKAGSDLRKIVKLNIYVTDMKNFPKVLKLREKFLSKPYPADTIVQVSALALPELQIEIDAVAVVGTEIKDAR